MTKYEGLFILNLAGREESVKDVIDRLGGVISELGGKVENVQKMDKRAFSRVTDKNLTGGFYVNFLFSGGPNIPAELATRFQRDEDVYRLLVTKAAKVAPAPVAA